MCAIPGLVNSWAMARETRDMDCTKWFWTYCTTSLLIYDEWFKQQLVNYSQIEDACGTHLARFLEEHCQQKLCQSQSLCHNPGMRIHVLQLMLCESEIVFKNLTFLQSWREPSILTWRAINGSRAIGWKPLLYSLFTPSSILNSRHLVYIFSFFLF